MEYPDPMITVMVKPLTASDQTILLEALSQIAEGDPYVQVTSNEESAEIVIGGRDELHLENIVERLESEFKVGVEVGAPQVAYRETVTLPVEVDYTHKDRDSGSGQFARVKIKFQPLARGAGIEFESAVQGTLISDECAAGVGRGLLSAAMKGAIAGFPITDVKMTLAHVETLGIDLSVEAFEHAGRAAFREGALKAGPKVLEPVMRVEVVAPEKCQHEIVDDLTNRRGKVYGQGKRDDMHFVNAMVPFANMFGFASYLRVHSCRDRRRADADLRIHHSAASRTADSASSSFCKWRRAATTALSARMATRGRPGSRAMRACWPSMIALSSRNVG
jgi:elongation factor G